MIRLALKMIRKDLKSSAFYLVVMTITVAVNFIFTATANGKVLTVDKVITDASQLNTLYAAVPASDYLNMVIVVFCCFLMFYVNNNYIFNKKNEIAILSVSGASTFQIIIYFLMQTAFLFLLACIPGIIIGYFGVHVFFQFVAAMMHTAVAEVDNTGLIQTFILIGVIFVYLIFYIIMYVYKVDVKELLASRNTAKIINNPPTRKIPHIVFFILYIVGVVTIILPNFPYENMSTQLFIVFVGLYGVINGFISARALRWKMKHSFTNQYLTISVSNYSSSMLTTKLTIMIMMFSVIMMFFVTMTYSTKINEMILSLAGYIIAVVLLSITVTFDLMIQAKQRVVYYFNLWKIGYTVKELMKIMRQELFMIYLTILVLPVLVIGPIGYRYVAGGAFDQTIYLDMVGFYMLFVVIMFFITYLLYGHTIKKSIVREK